MPDLKFNFSTNAEKTKNDFVSIINEVDRLTKAQEEQSKLVEALQGKEKGLIEQITQTREKATKKAIEDGNKYAEASSGLDKEEQNLKKLSEAYESSKKATKSYADSQKDVEKAMDELRKKHEALVEEIKTAQGPIKQQQTVTAKLKETYAETEKEAEKLATANKKGSLSLRDYDTAMKPISAQQTLLKQQIKESVTVQNGLIDSYEKLKGQQKENVDSYKKLEEHGQKLVTLRKEEMATTEKLSAEIKITTENVAKHREEKEKYSASLGASLQKEKELITAMKDSEEAQKALSAEAKKYDSIVKTQTETLEKLQRAKIQEKETNREALDNVKKLTEETKNLVELEKVQTVEIEKQEKVLRELNKAHLKGQISPDDYKTKKADLTQEITTGQASRTLTNEKLKANTQALEENKKVAKSSSLALAEYEKKVEETGATLVLSTIQQGKATNALEKEQTVYSHLSEEKKKVSQEVAKAQNALVNSTKQEEKALVAVQGALVNETTALAKMGGVLSATGEKLKNSNEAMENTKKALKGMAFEERMRGIEEFNTSVKDLISPLERFGKECMSAGKQANDLEKRLIGFSRSGEEARKVIEQIHKFSTEKQPFKLTDLMNAGIQMQKFGKNTEELLPKVANLAAGLKIGIEGPARAVSMALNDNQRGMMQLERQYGFTKDKLIEYGAQLKTSGQVELKSAETKKAIVAILDSYAGSAEKAGSSYNGAMTQMSNSIQLMKESIGKELLPLLAPLVQGAAKLVKTGTEFVSANKNVVASVLAVAAGLGMMMKVTDTVIGTVAGLQRAWGAAEKVYQTTTNLFKAGEITKQILSKETTLTVVAGEKVQQAEKIQGAVVQETTTGTVVATETLKQAVLAKTAIAARAMWVAMLGPVGWILAGAAVVGTLLLIKTRIMEANAEAEKKDVEDYGKKMAKGFKNAREEIELLNKTPVQIAIKGNAGEILDALTVKLKALRDLEKENLKQGGQGFSDYTTKEKVMVPIYKEGGAQYGLNAGVQVRVGAEEKEIDVTKRGGEAVSTAQTEIAKTVGELKTLQEEYDKHNVTLDDYKKRYGELKTTLETHTKTLRDVGQATIDSKEGDKLLGKQLLLTADEVDKVSSAYDTYTASMADAQRGLTAFLDQQARFKTDAQTSRANFKSAIEESTKYADAIRKNNEDIAKANKWLVEHGFKEEKAEDMFKSAGWEKYFNSVGEGQKKLEGGMTATQRDEFAKRQADLKQNENFTMESLKTTLNTIKTSAKQNLEVFADSTGKLLNVDTKDLEELPGETRDILGNVVKEYKLANDIEIDGEKHKAGEIIKAQKVTYEQTRKIMEDMLLAHAGDGEKQIAAREMISKEIQATYMQELEQKKKQVKAWEEMDAEAYAKNAKASREMWAQIEKDDKVSMETRIKMRQTYEQDVMKAQSSYFKEEKDRLDMGLHNYAQYYDALRTYLVENAEELKKFPEKYEQVARAVGQAGEQFFSDFQKENERLVKEGTMSTGESLKASLQFMKEHAEIWAMDVQKREDLERDLQRRLLEFERQRVQETSKIEKAIAEARGDKIGAIKAETDAQIASLETQKEAYQRSGVERNTIDKWYQTEKVKLNADANLKISQDNARVMQQQLDNYQKLLESQNRARINVKGYQTEEDISYEENRQKKLMASQMNAEKNYTAFYEQQLNTRHQILLKSGEVVTESGADILEKARNMVELTDEEQQFFNVIEQANSKIVTYQDSQLNAQKTLVDLANQRIALEKKHMDFRHQNDALDKDNWEKSLALDSSMYELKKQQFQKHALDMKMSAEQTSRQILDIEKARWQKERENQKKVSEEFIEGTENQIEAIRVQAKEYASQGMKREEIERNTQGRLRALYIESTKNFVEQEKAKLAEAVATAEAIKGLNEQVAAKQKELEALRGTSSFMRGEGDSPLLTADQALSKQRSPEGFSDPVLQKLQAEKQAEKDIGTLKSQLNAELEKEKSLNQDIKQLQQERLDVEDTFQKKVAETVDAIKSVSGETQKAEDSVDGLNKNLVKTSTSYQSVKEASPWKKETESTEDYNKTHGKTNSALGATVTMNKDVTKSSPWKGEAKAVEGYKKALDDAVKSATDLSNVPPPQVTGGSGGKEGEKPGGEPPKTGTENAVKDGAKEGSEKGSKEGTKEGAEKGSGQGTKEGSKEGSKEGAEKGTKEGAKEGTKEGMNLFNASVALDLKGAGGITDQLKIPMKKASDFTSALAGDMKSLSSGIEKADKAFAKGATSEAEHATQVNKLVSTVKDKVNKSLVAISESYTKGEISQEEYNKGVESLNNVLDSVKSSAVEFSQALSDGAKSVKTATKNVEKSTEGGGAQGGGEGTAPAETGGGGTGENPVTGGSLGGGGTTGGSSFTPGTKQKSETTPITTLSDTEKETFTKTSLNSLKNLSAQQDALAKAYKDGTVKQDEYVAGLEALAKQAKAVYKAAGDYGVNLQEASNALKTGQSSVGGEQGDTTKQNYNPGYAPRGTGGNNPGADNLTGKGGNSPQNYTDSGYGTNTSNIANPYAGQFGTPGVTNSSGSSKGVTTGSLFGYGGMESPAHDNPINDDRLLQVGKQIATATINKNLVDMVKFMNKGSVEASKEYTPAKVRAEVAQAQQAQMVSYPTTNNNHVNHQYDNRNYASSSSVQQTWIVNVDGKTVGGTPEVQKSTGALTSFAAKFGK